jgi:hypothetical protein
MLDLWNTIYFIWFSTLSGTTEFSKCTQDNQKKKKFADIDVHFIGGSLKEPPCGEVKTQNRLHGQVEIDEFWSYIVITFVFFCR